MNRLLIQQTTECLQNVYRGMLSSPQIRLKHFQRMMFPPIHQLRHTLCLFYQNMIQRIDGQKADLYITLTLCKTLYNIDFQLLKSLWFYTLIACSPYHFLILPNIFSKQILLRVFLRMKIKQTKNHKK